MLTLNTKQAIKLLHDIYYKTDVTKSNSYSFSDSTIQVLLNRMKSAGLICQRTDGEVDLLSSYRLNRPLFDITLSDLMTALGEGLHPVYGNTETIYDEYGFAARRLGVLNEVACEMLAKIHLTDL